MLAALRFGVLWFVCSQAMISPRAFSDEAGLLATRSSQFEQAWIDGDASAAEQLVMPDAKWILEQSKNASRILDDVESRGKRLKESHADRVDNRVFDRTVQVLDHAAVVTEWVRVENGQNPPLRRSLLWVRSGDQWKLAHGHVSPYLRWESDIKAFEAQDQENAPQEGGVIFIGSSSIRRWDTLADDFPDVPVMNRGFGGSQMIDSVLYARRVINPHKPRAVVVYAGDNDVSKGKDGNRVLRDFKNLVSSIREECPETRIGFIAIKPSLKRWNLWPEIQCANQLVESFAADHPGVSYLDIATPMLGDDGKPRPELFANDGLHLNEEGYAIWTEVIRPWLKVNSDP